MPSVYCPLLMGRRYVASSVHLDSLLTFYSYSFGSVSRSCSCFVAAFARFFDCLYVLELLRGLDIYGSGTAHHYWTAAPFGVLHLASRYPGDLHIAGTAADWRGGCFYRCLPGQGCRRHSPAICALGWLACGRIEPGSPHATYHHPPRLFIYSV